MEASSELEEAVAREAEKPKQACSICDEIRVPGGLTEMYPAFKVVCRECDSRAVNSEGSPTRHEQQYDLGDNPVFIDNQKCWRRYRFGGYATFLDEGDCESWLDFLAYYS